MKKGRQYIANQMKMQRGPGHRIRFAWFLYHLQRCFVILWVGLKGYFWALINRGCTQRQVDTFAMLNVRNFEEKWYAYWLEKQLFRSRPSRDKKPFVIAMPPPNITGILHVGHVLNQTKQDILLRRKRMQGYEACWVPGSDHASIATEAKVVGQLQKQGLTKAALGRDGFLAKAWAWKAEYEGIMKRQLRKLGISCDWERYCFTMDRDRSAAVIKAFLDLYQRGYIYRSKRMINWDPVGGTALSNEEVHYKNVEGHLYHIAYTLADQPGTIVVATTRPETLLGDTALCVHPNDDRYQHLHGHHAYVPIVGRKIPIIADTHVDATLGTGCLKVTPGHAFDDYALAQRHELGVINILTAEGKIEDDLPFAAGLDRFEARKQVIARLVAEEQLIDTTPYRHNVGFSERTGAVVEPRLSTQWFVRMKALAQPAIAAVKDGTIRFFPAHMVNRYMAWMEGIQDWCISRQLWWGHRLPVYYLPDESWVVAATPEEALEQARQQCGNPHLTMDMLQQDPDVLDTWFSSWLWPLSIFNGTIDRDNADFRYYFPTDDLVTAPEIIFFWVARMIMASYTFVGQPPFRHVYFTGIVRDVQQRKMSKSLGNSPDPLALIAEYGADGLRAGVLFSTRAGNDLLFEEGLCKQGARFRHKIAHAHRLISAWVDRISPTLLGSYAETAIAWFRARLQQAVNQVARHFENFELSDAFITIYKLIWDDFCARYLEMIKPAPGASMAQFLYEQTVGFLEVLMQLLHPFMPFITEEIWQAVRGRAVGASIMRGPFPEVAAYDEGILVEAEAAFELVTRIRRLRGGKKRIGQLSYYPATPPTWLTRFADYILKAAKIERMVAVATPLTGGATCLVAGFSFFLPTATVDPNEREKVARQLEEQRSFLARITAKLTNPRFLAGASRAVVDREKKKRADVQKNIEQLTCLLESFRS